MDIQSHSYQSDLTDRDSFKIGRVACTLDNMCGRTFPSSKQNNQLVR